MKKSSSLLLLSSMLYACSSAGDTNFSSLDPVSWPVGTYTLEATIVYQNDHEYGTGTLSEDFYVELVIAPGNSLTLWQANGVCQDPTPQRLERDIAMRRRSFNCGDFGYVVEPSGSTIRGELFAVVTERIRQRGRCLRFSDSDGVGRRCVEFEWFVATYRTQKRAALRVVD